MITAMGKTRLLFWYVGVVVILRGQVAAGPAMAGKCNPCNVTFPMQLTMDGLAALKPWAIIYAAGPPMYQSADYELRDGYRIGNNLYHVTDRRTMKDKSQNTYDYTTTIIDNIAVEEYTDENGERHRFYDYPLAITKENALLYYRCSDSGNLGVDTRYIEIPVNSTLSEESLQYLLEVDSSCNFRGALHKLPGRLSRPKP